MLTTVTRHERLYVLCYGDNQRAGRGIALVNLDQASGALSLEAFLPMREKPGALLCLEQRLWVSFLDEESGETGIQIFAVHADGLRHGVRRTTPWYYSHFHRSGAWILAASFRDGVDAVMAQEDPALLRAWSQHPFTGAGSADPRQQACHSHFIATLPEQTLAYATDLGTDQILCYRFDEGELTPQPHLTLHCPAGSGPRLMPLSHDGRFAYLLQEISNQLNVLEYTAQGFISRQTLALLPANEEASPHDAARDGTTSHSSAAACRITPDGNHLLVSVRGRNCLVIMRIAASTGLLSMVGRTNCGDTPRDLLVRGQHILVAAQGGNALEAYGLQQDAPSLISAAPPQRLALQAPVAIYAAT